MPPRHGTLGSAFRARPGHDVTINQVQRDIEDANRKRDSDSGLGDEVVTFTTSYLAKPHERCFVYRGGAAAATLTLPPPTTSYGRQRSFLMRATNRSTATLTVRFDASTTTALAAGASLMFWSDGTAYASVT